MLCPAVKADDDVPSWLSAPADAAVNVTLVAAPDTMRPFTLAETPANWNTFTRPSFVTLEPTVSVVRALMVPVAKLMLNLVIFRSAGLPPILPAKSSPPLCAMLPPAMDPALSLTLPPVTGNTV